MSDETKRRVTAISLAAATVLAAGNLALMRVGAATSPDDLSFERRWWTQRAPEDRPTVLVAGSSLSGHVSQARSLASELGRALAPVQNEAGDGFHLADVWASLLARETPQASVHLIEINPFVFNERRWMLVPRPSQRVVRLGEHGLPLLGVSSGSLRRELFSQLGLDPFLAAWVRQRFVPVHIGACLDSDLRLLLSRTLLKLKPDATDPGAFVRPPDEQLRDVVGQNFSRKQYGDGIDSQVLDELLAWIGGQEDPRAYVIYFPPLNLPLIRSTAGVEAEGRLLAWIEQVQTRCEVLGIPSSDMSAAFPSEEDFEANDYGHLQQRNFPELARLLIADLARQSER